MTDESRSNRAIGLWALVVGSGLLLCLVWYLQSAKNKEETGVGGITVVAASSTMPTEKTEAKRTDTQAGVAPENRPVPPVSKKMTLPEPVPSVTIDDARNSLPYKQSDPRTLFYKVRAQPRDEAWAGATEKALKELSASIPHIDMSSLEVLCATDICELRGALEPDLSSNDTSETFSFVRGDNGGKVFQVRGLKTSSIMFGGLGAGLPFTMYLNKE